MTSTVHPSENIQHSSIGALHSEYVQNALRFINIESKIRKKCIQIVRPGSHFNSFILALILLNSIAMAFTDYRFIDENYNPRTDVSTINFVIEKAEIFFFIVFVLEFILKITAYGFVLGKNTYLRDSWNQLDFIVLVLSAIGMTPLISNMSVIRTVRVLRPLRSLSRLPGLRKIIGALIDSIEDLWNVMLLLTFFLFCFSTVAVLFWGGKLNTRCRLTPFPIRMPKTCRSTLEPCWQNFISVAILDPDSYRCLPDANDNQELSQSTSPWFLRGPQDCVWPIDEDDERICSLTKTGLNTCSDKRSENNDIIQRTCGSNFDSFGNPRFLDTYEPYGFPRMQSSVFIEGLNWGYTNFDNFLSAFVTSFQIISMEGWTDIMYQVIDAWYIAPTIALFVIFILIGGHIVLNLVLAVITGSIDNLEQSQKDKKTKRSKEAKDQRAGEKGWITKIVESHIFGNFIMFCIILNTIILGMDRYMIPKETEMKLEKINLALNVVFMMEMCLFICALGLKKYCKNVMLIFDGSIVILSIIEMIISAFQPNTEAGQSVFSVFRALRIFRIFKLAKSWRSLNYLLRTMYTTIIEIGNFAILLFIFIFIYSLIGMQIFANRMHFDPMTGAVIGYGEQGYESADIPRSNFDTFFWSMTTVFQILSGENWNSIMYDGRRATSSMAVLYFISLVVFGAFIVMNLFLAILLKNFEDNDDEDDNSDESTNILPSINEETSEQNDKRNKLMKCLNMLPFMSKLIKRKGNPNMQSVEKQKSKYFGRGSFSQIKSHSIVEHSKFDSVITGFIIVSSICLALDNPLYDPELWHVKLLYILNIFFTAIFSIEAIAKILAHGFIFKPRAYLRNSWNVLDFTVVLVSILDLANIGPGQVLRTLRILRILRPLRMIGRFPQLKIVVDALLTSLPAVVNVAICCTLFFFIFAIFGVNFLKGTFYHCDGESFSSLLIDRQELVTNPISWGDIGNETKYLIQSEYIFCDANDWDSFYVPTSKELCECLAPGNWVETIPQNFNNVFSAMALLFEISSTEGWVDVMFVAVDQRGIDAQPVKNSNVIWVIFFVLFLLVGAFFVLELFVGVIIDNFNKIRDREGRVLMTEAQKEWASTQQFILRIKPERRMRRPSGPIRSKCYDFVMPGTNPLFEKAIMIFIIIGSLCTAATGFGDSEIKTKIFESISTGLTVIFTLEAAIKLTAHNKRYFQSGWNIFDFVIVCGTILGLILGHIFPGFSSITSIIRLCRIGRLFRLVKSVKSLRILFNTLLTSLPSIANVGSLLLLLFFIFSVCGVQLFSMVKSNSDLNIQANFRSFGNAMLLLVRFSTGENWNGFMRSMLETEEDCILNPAFNPELPWCMDENDYPSCTELNACGGKISMYIYFYTFTLIVSFVIFNLFVGVVLEAFENHEEGEILSPEDLEHFTSKWADFDPEATWYISATDLNNFVKTLEPPLGFKSTIEGKESGEEDEIVELSLLDIPVNDDGMVNIVQVATHLAKRLAKEKLGDAFNELPENNIVNQSDNNATHRTLRDIMHIALRSEPKKGEPKTGINRFRSAASNIIKSNALEKERAKLVRVAPIEETKIVVRNDEN